MELNYLATDISASGILLDIIIGIAVLVIAGLVAFVLYGRYHFFSKIGLNGLYGIIPFYSLYIICKEVASMNWWWFLVASVGYIVLPMNFIIAVLGFAATFFANYAIAYNLAIRMNKDKNWTLLGAIGLPILIAWEGIGDQLVYDPGVLVKPNGPFNSPRAEDVTIKKPTVPGTGNIKPENGNNPPVVALGLDTANPQQSNGLHAVGQPQQAQAAPVAPNQAQPVAQAVPTNEPPRFDPFATPAQPSVPSFIDNNPTSNEPNITQIQNNAKDLKDMFNTIPDEPLDISVKKDDLILKPTNTNVDLSEAPIFEEKPIDPEVAKQMRKRRKTLAQREAEEELKEAILEELKGELKPEEYDTEKIKEELRAALKEELKPEEIDKEKIKEELKASLREELKPEEIDKEQIKEELKNSLREELKPADIDEEKLKEELRASIKQDFNKEAIKEELKASLKEELKPEEINQEQIKQELVASLKEELKQDSVDTERIINELRASLKVELKPGEIDLEKLKNELRVALIDELKNEASKEQLDKEQIKNELKESLKSELKNELKKEALFKKEEDEEETELVENSIEEHKDPIIVTTPIGEMVEEKKEEVVEEVPSQPLEDTPLEDQKEPTIVVKPIDEQLAEQENKGEETVESTPEIIATPVDEKKVDDALASIIESLKSINSLSSTQPIAIAVPVEEEQPTEPVAENVSEPEVASVEPEPQVVTQEPIVESTPADLQPEVIATPVASEVETVDKVSQVVSTPVEEPQNEIIFAAPIAETLQEETDNEPLPDLPAEELNAVTQPIPTVTDTASSSDTSNSFAGQTPSVTPLRRQQTKPVMPSSAAPTSKFKQE